MLESSTAILGSLFVSSFLASTLLPGGSEVVLAGLSASGAESNATLLIVATLGNTLGGMTSWGLGRWLRHRGAGRSLSRPGTVRALAWTEKHGAPILLLAWLPVVGDPLCLAAGWLRVHPLAAALYIGIGKGVRYFAVLSLVDPIAQIGR